MNNAVSKCANTQVHALILAAGLGTRFSRAIKKQYQLLDLSYFSTDAQAPKTVLEHSISAVLNSDDIKSLALVVAKNDSKINHIDTQGADIVIGGATRFESMQNGFWHVAKTANDDDLLLIHDGARPCLCAHDLQKVIDVAKTHDIGAMLAHPVHDTLKKYSHQRLDNIDRTNVWCAQTPQVFRIKALKQALTLLSDDANASITDEASIFAATNMPPPLLVQGKKSNIKLTCASDLPLVCAILQMMG